MVKDFCFLYPKQKVREARSICFKLFLVVLMFICMHGVFCWEKWSCMCVWVWIRAGSAIACGWTVVNSAIFAQASSSRLGESTREPPATRTRLGGPFSSWATHSLAQARRPRLSEISWSPHVERLAWARIRCFREDSISPEREFVKIPRCMSRLGENPLCPWGQRLAWASLRMCAMLSWLFGWFVACMVWVILPKYGVREYAWVFGFLWMKLTCLVWDWSWSCGFVMF